MPNKYFNAANIAAGQKRDPNRIEGQIEALKEFWLQHPDWRLVQLVRNVSEWEPPSGKVSVDTFYQEDTEFFSKLSAYPYAPKEEL